MNLSIFLKTMALAYLRNRVSVTSTHSGDGPHLTI